MFALESQTNLFSPGYLRGEVVHADHALTAADALWDNPTMTLTADSKRRVVLPGAAPGDVFTCQQKGLEMVLRRVHRAAPQKKKTKADILKAIRKWKSVPNIRWEELRKMTREP
jgi:hypothetical protein